MLYMKYGSCWSDCDWSILLQFDFKPDSAIVGDNDRGSS
jgi:hypothetical protein